MGLCLVNGPLLFKTNSHFCIISMRFRERIGFEGDLRFGPIGNLFPALQIAGLRLHFFRGALPDQHRFPHH
jgi:hypothetical protein